MNSVRKYGLDNHVESGQRNTALTEIPSCEKPSVLTRVYQYEGMEYLGERFMGKKISVITLHRVMNYGSVLQSYATQTLLQKFGYDVEFVDYRRPDLGDSFRDVVARTSWNGDPLRRAVYRAVWGKQIARNRRVFNAYVSEKLVLTPVEYGSSAELRASPPEADLYCVGSDQVWNDDYNVGGSEPFFLDYAGSDSPKISYASSIGKSEVSDAETKLIETYLPNFSGVSVREYSSVSLLARLNIEAKHVLDPTLTLTPAEWDDEHLVGSQRPPYLLVYQLNKSPEFDARVEELCRRTGLTPLRLTIWQKRYQSLGGKLVQPSVEEWVTAFRRASHVITDSFHGVAFSINFERPLTVVLPPKYQERLRSILDLVKAVDRVALPGEALCLEEMDWETHTKCLNEAREDSLEWLQKHIRDALFGA